LLVFLYRFGAFEDLYLLLGFLFGLLLRLLDLLSLLIGLLFSLLDLLFSLLDFFFILLLLLFIGPVLAACLPFFLFFIGTFLIAQGLYFLVDPFRGILPKTPPAFLFIGIALASVSFTCSLSDGFTIKGYTYNS
jgi:hypothetical protein